MKNEPFSYAGYKIVQQKEVISIDLGVFQMIVPSFKRYTKILMDNNIYDTVALIEAYNRLELKSIRGLGQKFYSIVKDFAHNQKKYMALYDEFNNNEIKVEVQ